jgi:hypothetical protein
MFYNNGPRLEKSARNKQFSLLGAFISVAKAAPDVRHSCISHSITLLLQKVQVIALAREY